MEGGEGNKRACRGRAVIELDGDLAEAVLKALEPEVKWPPPAERVELTVSKNKIVIEAKDLTALRAALNSFLYWIYAAAESLEKSGACN